jgi:hypothetical protein
MTNWKRFGRGRGLTEVLSRHLSEGSEENHEKSVRIAGVLTEIRSAYLRNKSLELYQQTRPYTYKSSVYVCMYLCVHVCRPMYVCLLALTEDADFQDIHVC